MKLKKIALLLATIIGTTPITTYAQGFGICSHVAQGHLGSEIVRIVSDANINWCRDECYWKDVEKIKGRFKVPEHVVEHYRNLHKRGVKVLLVLSYGNTLYTLSDGSSSGIYVVPTSSEPEYMEGWKQYIRTVVNALGDYVDAYEVWNEPDGMNSLLSAGDAAMAKAYVDCYVNTKSLLDEIMPGKPVLFGALFSGGNDRTTIAFYDELQSAAKKQEKNFDDIVDDISFHFYVDNRGTMNSHFYNQETRLDAYGFTGDIWFTETGLSETVDSTVNDEAPYTQAEYLPMAAIEWDRYIRDSGRDGVGFWYDIRNDGTNPRKYEHNFGLVDYNYNEKPAFYAMKARNIAVNYMPLINYDEPQTNSVWDTLLNGAEYGVLATYSDGINTTYAGYDENGNGKTISISLSGTKAYVYDYLGNVIKVLDPNITSTYKMPLDETVTYVACVNPRIYINYAEYNEGRNIVIVDGKVSTLDVETIELVISDVDGNAIYKENVPVKDERFNTEFSAPSGGVYTITAGKNVVNYYAEYELTVTKEKEKKKTLGDSVVSVLNDQATITGTVSGTKDGETVSILVVPQGADLTNLKPENIAYIDDTKVTGETYSISFEMPEKSEGTYQVLLSGVNLANSSEETLNYGEASGYVNVCDFDYTLGSNIITVKAGLNNPAATSKNCAIIIAQYTKEGTLITVNTTTVTIDSNVVQAVEKEATASLDSEAASAKAFVWDSLTGLRPLVNDLPIILN